MKKAKRVLAFDFGASSGRAMIGSFDGGKIELEEIHRFPNDPVRLGDTLYWDTPRQFYEIRQGILKCKRAGGADSIGIDTWGVDFGLLDRDGFLLENQVHYRDARTRGMIEKAEKLLPKREIYRSTGIQFMEYNTVFQLLSILQNRPALLERAETLLMTPDLMGYFLTGEKTTEYTIASTSQLLSARSGEWDTDVMKRLGIPERLFTGIIRPGLQTGLLTPQLCRELDVDAMPVIAVASHDTASAVAAVPSCEENFAYLSSGTWSLLGTETKSPVVTEESMAGNFTNEGGYGGTIRLLKNISGLWLIQESRRHWQSEGEEVTFAQLEKEAGSAAPFRSFINPDAPELSLPGDIPGRIRELCRASGQPVPQSRSEIMRCIYESLALKYRQTLSNLEKITGRRYSAIHIVGGGTRDRLLSSLTANACGRHVTAGPSEATVLGNIAVQLIAAGEIDSLAQARRVIADSFPVYECEPADADSWSEAATRFDKICHII